MTDMLLGIGLIVAVALAVATAWSLIALLILTARYVMTGDL